MSADQLDDTRNGASYLQRAGPAAGRSVSPGGRVELRAGLLADVMVKPGERLLRRLAASSL